MLKSYTVSIVTDASGDFTGYLASSSTGRVHAIKYEPGTVDSGATLVLTGETTEIPIYTKASVGSSDTVRYPRAVASLADDGSDLAYSSADICVLRERIKLVVSSGGNAKTGTLTVYVDEYEV